MSPIARIIFAVTRIQAATWVKIPLIDGLLAIEEGYRKLARGDSDAR